MSYKINKDELNKQLQSPINSENAQSLLNALIFMLYYKGRIPPNNIYDEDKSKLIEQKLNGLICKEMANASIKYLRNNGVNIGGNDEVTPIYDQLVFEKLNDKREIIKVNNMIYSFEEVYCLEALISKWTESSLREIFQSYYFIQCIKEFGLNAYRKTQPIKFSDNFNNILNYEEEILKKIHKLVSQNKIESSTFFKHIEMFRDLSFGKENDIKIFNEILPRIERELNITRDENCDLETDAIVLHKNLISFNEKVCESLLRKELKYEKTKLELIQTLFLSKYYSFFKNSSLENEYNFNTNLEKIDFYKDRIINKLKGNISENELESAIKKAGFKLDVKNIEIVLNTLSIDLDSTLHTESKYNDVLVFSLENSALKEISFRDVVCEKLLSKSITDTTIREFVQTYFIYIYKNRIKTPLLNKNKEVVYISESINNIDLYIELIDKKINGVVTPEQFDKSIKIVIDILGLNEESKKEIEDLVIFPIKRRLGINKRSLFKHVL